MHSPFKLDKVLKAFTVKKKVQKAIPVTGRGVVRGRGFHIF
jgi:hypothetical protein